MGYGGAAMKPSTLTRSLALAACLAAMTGCATRTPPMYLWQTFPKVQYDTLQQSGNFSPEHIQSMEAQAERAKASGALLPPGFRAHLGMLKLSSGDSDSARNLWQAEKSAFPESSPYIDQLLKRLDTPAKKDKPA